MARGRHADYTVMTNALGSFLAYKNKLYVPQRLVAVILHEYHDARGHFGVNRT